MMTKGLIQKDMPTMFLSTQAKVVNTAKTEIFALSTTFQQ